MITPRPRQVKAIEDLRSAYLFGHRAPILIAPTGFGKSATAICMIQIALDKGKRVWFIAHLKEILNDTSGRLTDAGIKHGWIASGRDGNRSLSVQVAMVQTLVRRLDRYQPPDLIIVDEAHLAVANTYQQIFEWAGAGPKFKRPGGAHLLHLTATPCRLDGRGMGEVADILVPTCSTQDLIDEELLALRLKSNSAERDVNLDGMRAALGMNAEEALLLVAPSPEEVMEEKDIQKLIEEQLVSITPREEKVLRLRYGIGCEEHTLEETGQVLEVTRERIRQIEIHALRKLKHPQRATVLKQLTEEYKPDGVPKFNLD